MSLLVFSDGSPCSLFVYDIYICVGVLNRRYLGVVWWVKLKHPRQNFPLNLFCLFSDYILLYSTVQSRLLCLCERQTCLT